VIVAATLAVLALAAWYLTSARFQERVRSRVVAELELMTGGRVELQSFHCKPAMLQFEVRGLTIHGLEASDQSPYLHADRLLVRLKILSFFRRQITLRELEVERPLVHIIVYPDGSTNQPAPGSRPAGEAVAGVLFDIAVDRLSRGRGHQVWQLFAAPCQDRAGTGAVARQGRTPIVQAGVGWLRAPGARHAH
jgi:translocation and assembly module TamB